MLTKSRPDNKAKPTYEGFVICIQNKGYEASLERLKVYLVVHDQDAKSNNQIRIVDESGDDYLYPTRFFATIELPQAAKRILREAV